MTEDLDEDVGRIADAFSRRPLQIIVGLGALVFVGLFIFTAVRSVIG